MYYIYDKHESNKRIEFGIMDTSDGVVEYYTTDEIRRMVRDFGIKIEGVSFKTRVVLGHPRSEIIIKVKQREIDANWENLINGDYRITENCDLVRQMKTFGNKLGMHVDYSAKIELDESCFDESVFGLTMSEALRNNIDCLRYYVLNAVEPKYRLTVCYDFESKGFYISTDYNGYTVFGTNVLKGSYDKFKFKDLVGLFFNI